MKLKHISAAIALTLFLPFAASAITIEELQTQVARLLAQVASLQEQLKSLQTIPSVEPTRPTNLPPGTRVCPQILRQLSQGTSGEDVRGLQAYLGVSQTGYFGPMTASAVAQFQSSEGISQVGAVGPQTRAAFARRCGGGNTAGFSAAPTSGAAPLSVTFRASAGDETSVSIDFGDGSARGQASVDSTNAGYRTITHTYTKQGTYTATAYKSDGMCGLYGGTNCTKVAGSVRITVGGSTSNTTFSASPTSGAAPLEVKFTFPSSGADSYSINFGDGQTGGPLVGPSCNPDGGCLSTRSAYHTYSLAGTYTASLEKQYVCNATPGASCIGLSSSEVGKVTVTVGGSTSTGAPTISLLSPNGGETWQGVLGQTIRWSSSNVTNGTVNIYLIGYDYNPQTEDNRTHYLLVKYAANTGSYTIDSLVSPTQVKPGNNYRISIGAYQQTSTGQLDYDNLVQGDLSDAPFTIKD